MGPPCALLTISCRFPRRRPSEPVDRVGSVLHSRSENPLLYSQCLKQLWINDPNCSWKSASALRPECFHIRRCRIACPRVLQHRHRTSILTFKRSNRSIAAKTARTIKRGGARRDRTDDLKLAKLPLSQLSYGPSWNPNSAKRWWARTDLNCRPHAYQACALTN